MLKGEEIIKNLMLQNMRLQGKIKNQQLELRRLKYEPAQKSCSCPNLAELDKSYSFNQSKVTDFYPKISMNIQRTPNIKTLPKKDIIFVNSVRRSGREKKKPVKYGEYI